jgi:type I restriction enzyme S subunit
MLENCISLSDSGYFFSGGTPSTNNSDFWNGNLPWISSSDLTHGDMYGVVPKKFITQDAVNSCSTKLASKGDILLVSRVGVGKVAIAPKDLYVSQDFTILKPIVSIVPEFLAYWLLSNKSLLIKYSQGTSIKGFTREDLKLIQFPLIDYNIQMKVSNILSSVDKKIELLREKKKLTEDFKKGMMQKLFSQELRFTKQDGSQFEDWITVKVSDIFTVRRGNVLPVSSVKKIQDSFYKYPVFSSQTKSGGLLGFYNEYIYEDSITWTTDGANAGEVNFRKGHFYCTNVCGVLINKKGFSNTCIATALSLVSKKFVSYVGNPKLMGNVFSKIQVCVPSSFDEQNKISSLLLSIDKKINLIEEQIKKTEDLKKGLMQQLFPAVE